MALALFLYGFLLTQEESISLLSFGIPLGSAFLHRFGPVTRCPSVVSDSDLAAVDVKDLFAFAVLWQPQELSQQSPLEASNSAASRWRSLLLLAVASWVASARKFSPCNAFCFDEDERTSWTLPFFIQRVTHKLQLRPIAQHASHVCGASIRYLPQGGGRNL